MIKFIYFDFGGVLVNYERALQGMCGDFNLDFEEFMKFYDQFDLDLALGRIKTDEFWKRCIEKYNLKDAESYDLPKSWVADYDIVEPVNKLIYSLENKIDMGIISNINSGIWEAAFRDKWVPDIGYKNILLSYKLGITKPNREVYKIAQQESGVNPEEILFIDDQVKNLVVPRENGWKTIQFDRFKAEEGTKKIIDIIDE